MRKGKKSCPRWFFFSLILLTQTSNTNNKVLKCIIWAKISKPWMFKGLCSFKRTAGYAGEVSLATPLTSLVFPFSLQSLCEQLPSLSLTWKLGVKVSGLLAYHEWQCPFLKSYDILWVKTLLSPHLYSEYQEQPHSWATWVYCGPLQHPVPEHGPQSAHLKAISNVLKNAYSLVLTLNWMTQRLCKQYQETVF